MTDNPIGRPPCDRPDDCRIQAVGPGRSTLLFYPPIYDGHGNNLNPDRNTTRQDMRCYTCGREWIDTTAKQVEGG